MTDVENLSIVVTDLGSSNGKSGTTGYDIPEHLDGPLFPLTDLGNAERLVAHHGNDLRYCRPWKRWLYWDGTRWREDLTGDIGRRAKATVRAIYQEARAIEDGDRRQEVAKHAVKSESHRLIEAMLRRAEDEASVAAHPDQFDTDPYLLACPNGTVNLKTGELCPAQRDHFLTKRTATPYEPDAPAPVWMRFLDRVMNGNADLIDFLQRAAGYSLTGLTSEEVIFFLYGTGRNGKSKFVTALQFAMGEYAKTTRPETLMAKPQGGNIPNDIAALLGARMVPTVEVEDGARLAESLVKQLTGGDMVSARFLHGEYFTFRPTFKIWIAGNHKPVIRGSDMAIWERILTVPFTVTIPREERDKDLAQKLEREAPGILAWMVRGCLAWRERGLDAPSEVRAATEEYRGEMDVLAEFIEECCEERRDAVTPARSLYDRYQEWAREAGQKAWSEQSFGRRLKERGFIRDRFGQTRVWQGVGLKSGAEA